jgi:hypothetical protein
MNANLKEYIRQSLKGFTENECCYNCKFLFIQTIHHFGGYENSHIPYCKKAKKGVCLNSETLVICKCDEYKNKE